MLAFQNGAGKHSVRVLAEDSDKPQQMIRILKVRLIPATSLQQWRQVHSGENQNDVNCPRWIRLKIFIGWLCYINCARPLPRSNQNLHPLVLPADLRYTPASLPGHFLYPRYFHLTCYPGHHPGFHHTVHSRESLLGTCLSDRQYSFTVPCKGPLPGGAGTHCSHADHEYHGGYRTVDIACYRSMESELTKVEESGDLCCFLTWGIVRLDTNSPSFNEIVQLNQLPSVAFVGAFRIYYGFKVTNKTDISCLDCP